MEPQSSHQGPVCFFIKRRELHQAECGYAHFAPLPCLIALADVAAEGHLPQPCKPKTLGLQPTFEVVGTDPGEIVCERPAIQVHGER